MTANKTTCNRIICGFIPQSVAGQQLLIDCARAGYTGVRPGCSDEVCRPYSNGECGPATASTGLEPRPAYRTPPTSNSLPFNFPSPPRVAYPRVLTSPMPSITPAKRPAPITADDEWNGSEWRCRISRWVRDNPGMAVIAAVLGWQALRKK